MPNTRSMAPCRRKVFTAVQYRPNEARAACSSVFKLELTKLVGSITLFASFLTHESKQADKAARQLNGWQKTLSLSFASLQR